MDKTEAMKRLDAIEEEAKELRKIIIENKKMKIYYDWHKLYVGVKDNVPYLLLGEDSKHFNFYNIRCTDGRWYDIIKNSQECIDSHIKDGFEIYEFDDTRKALEFFLGYLK
jgi:hypothetical protein